MTYSLCHKHPWNAFDDDEEVLIMLHGYRIPDDLALRGWKLVRNDEGSIQMLLVLEE
jgi:hypothetical protein